MSRSSACPRKASSAGRIFLKLLRAWLGNCNFENTSDFCGLNQIAPLLLLHSHIKSGEISVKLLTTVHATSRHTIDKSISSFVHVLSLFHLSLCIWVLRYMKEGNTELVKNKTGEQPLGTPTPALVDYMKIVGSGTGRSETSCAFP